MALHEGDPEKLGEYQIVDRLGAGGMGVVYRARSRSGREVAVKVVHNQYASDAVFRARFRQEIAAARKVSGAFTAAVVDADPDAGRPWMATQYVPGRALSARVRDDGPLRGTELRRLALGLVEALRDIHRAGVVHRDLKPANVLMADDGPRVIDFGISRAAENQQLTETGHMMGTPPFMSPEQLTDARTVGPASDVFSLAALLTFAATGKGPFDADSPYIAAYQVLTDPPDLSGIPDALHGTLVRCLAKDPAERPTLDALAPILATALPDEDGLDEMPTVLHRPPNPVPTQPPPAPAPRRRSRRTPLLAGIAGALAIALGVFLVPQFKKDDTKPTPSPSPTRWEAVPTGWRPWQTTVFATAAAGLAQASKPNNDGYKYPSCALDTGSVYCAGAGTFPVRIDTATGRTLWRIDPLPPGTPIEDYNADVIGVHDGVLLVNESTASEDRLVAYATTDGERLWTRSVGERYAQPTLVGDLVLVPDGGTVTARTPKDGKARWSTTLPFDYGCDFRVGFMECTNYHTASGTDRQLLTLDPADGTTRRLTSAPPVNSEYAGLLDGRPVYVAVRKDSLYGKVLVIDLKADTARTTDLAEPQEGAVALAHGALTFAATSGRVTAVSPLTGKRLWQTATSLERPGGAVPDTRGAFFLTTASGRAAALDARTGTLLWETRPRATVGSLISGMPTPALLDRGALLVVTPEGTLFSIDPAHPGA
ncbi:protein kinase domain-containing protein [Streptomyces acidiscabies]|uniref:Serine/threonine protein kinase n=1 Tax=Streptomyces acidiscabies TaxID=42234 RepID=A0A0L0KLC8_9ACTN|nr:PQQ-binding-like beta-propeller repeat protein [Streptomyces acidiscabies]KND38621.1 serine/threonine protein kinase [Streptomyces acidiscabies]